MADHAPIIGGLHAHGLTRGFSAERASLVVYLMAGYPDPETSLASLHAAADAGADLIELGVPYGDPLADGPVIARAGHAARSQPGGFGLEEALELAGRFIASREAPPPVAAMTYVNPMLRIGFPATTARAEDAGLGGFIVPDLPPDNPMADRWLEWAAKSRQDTVFLVAPTSTDARLRAAVGASTGFVYVVSSVGITGERATMRSDLGRLVGRVREARGGTGHPDIPVAVGFGISTAEQAADVARIADGVVVGSAVVKRQEDPAAVTAFVAELAGAVRSAR